MVTDILNIFFDMIIVPVACFIAIWIIMEIWDGKKNNDNDH